MLHYIFVFLILLLIISFSAQKSLWVPNRNNKIGESVCLLLLCCLSAFKASTIGNDTDEYLRIFEMGEDALMAGTRYEIGYLYFSQIVWKISHNPQVLFIVYSLIFYFSLRRFLWRYSSMPWLSVLIFFSYTLFGFSMSALRQSLAIAILFIGFDFVLKKKYILFFVSIIGASLFHFSAIFFALCPLILKLKPSKRTVSLFVGSTLVIFLLLGNLLDTLFSYLPYYGHYQEGAYFEGGVRIASVFQLLLAILFLCIGYISYNKIPNDNTSSEKEFLGHLVVIQMVVVSLSILCLKVNILDRIVLYYSTFVLLLIPNAISLMSYGERKTWGRLTLLAVFLYTLIIIILRPDWNNVFPYKFCWEETYLTIY